jgi:hypothetical protein
LCRIRFEQGGIDGIWDDEHAGGRDTGTEDGVLFAR